MSNFTPRAEQVLALARSEAERLHHNFVGTEHLLLGLIRLGQGIAVNVLEKIGLDLEMVRAEVERVVGSGPQPKIIGDLLYTPRVKKVLALAAKIALRSVRKDEPIAGGQSNSVETSRPDLSALTQPTFTVS